MENRERRRSTLCRGRRQWRSAEEEAAASGRRVRELRRLAPGSAAVPTNQLLLRTADYIVRLRARVELLRALSELISAHHGSGHADGDEAAIPLAS